MQLLSLHLNLFKKKVFQKKIIFYFGFNFILDIHFKLKRGVLSLCQSRFYCSSLKILNGQKTCNQTMLRKYFMNGGQITDRQKNLKANWWLIDFKFSPLSPLCVHSCG